METLARDLKAFLTKLKKRPDVTIEAAEIGKKASRKELAALGDAPDELRALYAQMNGVHIEWRFIEPSGGGCIRIPPASFARFAGDDETFMRFGDSSEALLLDENRPEGGCWIVRDRATRTHRLVFAAAGQGDEGFVPATSIAEYVRKGMESGFGYWWPACFRNDPRVSYAEQEEATRRFRAPPKEPSEIRPEVRVHFAYFAEGGRGTVLRIHEATASAATEHHGTTIAEVLLDEGSVAWIPTRFMKAQKKTDAYERLRTSLSHEPWPREPLAVLEQIARAIGPVSHWMGGRPSNARLAAGILSARPIDKAIGLVAALYEDAVAAGIDLEAQLPLAKSGEELSPSDWSRARWKHRATDTFAGLFAGLEITLSHGSARSNRAPAALVDPAVRAKLEAIEIARPLIDALANAAVLEAPKWHFYGDDDTAVRDLGLSEGAILLSGTGY